jgi:PAS domain-containing protein
MLAVAFITLIASALLGLAVTKSIAVPLSELGSAAEKVANGEMDVQFDFDRSESNDEITRLSLRMQENLMKMRMADEQTSLMLDTTPLCCSLWDKKRNMIACNQEAVNLFGLQNKQEYMQKFPSLSPKYQPCGTLSNKKILQYTEKAFRDGYCRFEWLYQTLSGKPIPCETTLVRVKYKDDYIVAGYNRDLRGYKKIMAEIERRDELLNKVNDMSAILLKTDVDTLETDLWEAMDIIARAVYADRAYIWKNYIQDGELHCSQIYEWSEAAGFPESMRPASGVSYSGVRFWKKELSENRSINSLVRDMPEEEQNILSPQGALSIFA